jgi:oxygen-independent coproporphyrinogen-3 oxidase
MDSVYIHVPFCFKKCLYCDFSSRVGTPALQQAYIQALEQEMRRVRHWVDPNRLRTIYIGGGTPTTLGNQELERLLQLCREHFLPLFRSWEGEFTVEANPGTVDPDKCRILLHGGVNRVSLGAQSFNDRFLQALGRGHKTSDIVNSYSMLRDNNISNINIDLIFGLPGQALDHWKIDLEKGLDLSPEHFSIYNLTISPGTPFYENPPPLPSEDEQITMMEFAEITLTAAGYNHYEISNYARYGKHSPHNVVYWKGGEYLGLGPGAHSYYNNRRRANVSSVEEYISKTSSHKTPVAFSETIDDKTRAAEALLTGLRLLDGVSDQLFARRFGPYWGDKLASLFEGGFLEHTSGMVRFTHRGMLVSDEVFLQLV